MTLFEFGKITIPAQSDCQPFSIVEDVGFTHSLKALDSRYSLPSWKYFTETVLPQIHQGITAESKKEIAGISWFSFTTDIWSKEVSNDSLVSSPISSLKLLKGSQQFSHWGNASVLGTKTCLNTGGLNMNMYIS